MWMISYIDEKVPKSPDWIQYKEELTVFPNGEIAGEFARWEKFEEKYEEKYKKKCEEKYEKKCEEKYEKKYEEKYEEELTVFPNGEVAREFARWEEFMRHEDCRTQLGRNVQFLHLLQN